MKVLVTGATGFVGRYVVGHLVERGHAVTTVARDTAKAGAMPWRERVKFVAADLHRDWGPVLANPGEVDVMVHLAWPGLPNFRDFFHLERNLPADLRFLAAAVKAGVPRLVVAGTCLEYGLQEGGLREDQATAPITPYGLAKDTLRKSLEMLSGLSPFTLQWGRIFYMYGEGQYASALLPQLDRAIAEGRPEFDMSPGDQLRDYLPVEEVAMNFVRLVEHPEITGVVNCSSGKPISVRDLVELHCARRGASIKLNRGRYPYPAYEPMAFWGVPAKLASLAR